MMPAAMKAVDPPQTQAQRSASQACRQGATSSESKPAAQGEAAWRHGNGQSHRLSPPKPSAAQLIGRNLLFLPAMCKTAPAGLGKAGGYPGATQPVPRGQAMCKQIDVEIGWWVILPPSSSSSAHIPPTDVPPHPLNTSTHLPSPPKSERQGSKQRQTGQPHAPYSRFALQKKRTTFSSSLFSRKMQLPARGPLPRPHGEG